MRNITISLLGILVLVIGIGCSSGAGAPVEETHQANWENDYPAGQEEAVQDQEEASEEELSEEEFTEEEITEEEEAETQEQIDLAINKEKDAEGRYSVDGGWEHTEQSVYRKDGLVDYSIRVNFTLLNLAPETEGPENLMIQFWVSFDKDIEEMDDELVYEIAADLYWSKSQTAIFEKEFVITLEANMTHNTHLLVRLDSVDDYEETDEENNDGYFKTNLTFNTGPGSDVTFDSGEENVEDGHQFVIVDGVVVEDGTGSSIQILPKRDSLQIEGKKRETKP